MKTRLIAATILLAAQALLTPEALADATSTTAKAESATNHTEAIDLVRSTYKADRKEFIATTLQLTESEGAAFWPLYRGYRAEMEKLGDSLVKLVLEYADAYPNVPEERARKMLKEYTDLEEKLVTTRSAYLRRAAKVLPAAKVLRWAQLENRLDLALRLQIAGTVPLVAPPAEAKPQSPTQNP
jgi:hypothetical protein